VCEAEIRTETSVGVLRASATVPYGYISRKTEA
jgi:hypothetical protein